MKDILTTEAKQFIVVKVDAKGEPEGVLTRRTSRYGSSIAVSPFNLENLAIAIKANSSELLNSELDHLIATRKTYQYDDFKIIEMETQTTITFGKEVAISKEKERIINNNRTLIVMAKEWGKQWRKDNPDKPSNVWEGTPFNSPYVVNPIARKYYTAKLNELNWKENEDYNYSAQCEAYNTFIKAIR